MTNCIKLSIFYLIIENLKKKPPKNKKLCQKTKNFKS